MGIAYVRLNGSGRKSTAFQVIRSARPISCSYEPLLGGGLTTEGDSRLSVKQGNKQGKLSDVPATATDCRCQPRLCGLRHRP